MDTESKSIEEKVIGRKAEIAILQSALISPEAELVSLTGRRRIGKTYLVRNVYRGRIIFELEGVMGRSRYSQLQNFAFRLQEASDSDEELPVPPDWMTAFHRLTQFLKDRIVSEERKVVFIDELPWLATHKSDFLTGFGYFWNSFASRHNLVVVISGSAAAWMIRKVIDNRGSLHNRVTKRIELLPFTLNETEAFLKYRGLNFNRYQATVLYIVMGGVPFYLKNLVAGRSAVQNINLLCFHPNGILKREFENLFNSLFNKPEDYEKIIHILSVGWQGKTRPEIMREGGFRAGGALTRKLQELALSGFITPYYPMGRKKNNIVYRLTDNYCLFYLTFIKETQPISEDHWQLISQTQNWKSWSGFAFENICFQHVKEIKKALQIGGVATSQYSYFAKANEDYKGLQIDLLLERADNIISLIEVKFYGDLVKITENGATKLRRKRTLFIERTKTRKFVQINLVTTFGIEPTKHSNGLIDNVLTLDDLFDN